MGKSNRRWMRLVVTRLVVAQCMLTTGVALAGPADEIVAKALHLNLGKPHPQTPSLKRAASLRDRGFFQRFERGWVYWSWTTGAHAVYETVFAKWAELGGEQGILGFPITDERPSPDGRGRFSDFQGGTIYWTPTTGAHAIHGQILAKWAQLGGVQGFLGYPLTDQTASPVASGVDDRGGGTRTNCPVSSAISAVLGRERVRLKVSTNAEFAEGKFHRSNFEGGYILWSPANGTQVISSDLTD